MVLVLVLLTSRESVAECRRLHSHLRRNQTRRFRADGVSIIQAATTFAPCRLDFNTPLILLFHITAPMPSPFVATIYKAFLLSLALAYTSFLPLPFPSPVFLPLSPHSSYYAYNVPIQLLHTALYPAIPSYRPSGFASRDDA